MMGFNTEKCKIELKTAIIRLEKHVKPKAQAEVRRLDQDVVRHLQNGQYDSALLLAERVVRGENSVVAMDLAANFARQVQERLPQLAAARREVPGDLRECVGSLMFAAGYFGAEVAELLSVRKALAARYGKAYDQEVAREPLQAGVSRQLWGLLSGAALPEGRVVSTLQRLGAAAGVPWPLPGMAAQPEEPPLWVTEGAPQTPPAHPAPLPTALPSAQPAPAALHPAAAAMPAPLQPPPLTPSIPAVAPQPPPVREAPAMASSSQPPFPPGAPTAATPSPSFFPRQSTYPALAPAPHATFPRQPSAPTAVAAPLPAALERTPPFPTLSGAPPPPPRPEADGAAQGLPWFPPAGPTAPQPAATVYPSLSGSPSASGRPPWPATPAPRSPEPAVRSGPPDPPPPAFQLPPAPGTPPHPACHLPPSPQPSPASSSSSAQALPPPSRLPPPPPSVQPSPASNSTPSPTPPKPGHMRRFSVENLKGLFKFSGGSKGGAESGGKGQCVTMPELGPRGGRDDSYEEPPRWVEGGAGGGGVSEPLPGAATAHTEASTGASRQLAAGGLRSYSLADIEEMTRGFRTCIGKGGFGSVYFGRLPDQQPVAVKRKSGQSLQGSGEFLKELEMPSLARHRNLVNLLGYCDEGQEQILVYDYVPGGTLGQHLFQRGAAGGGGEGLSWPRRLSIALGTAQALDYLHVGTSFSQALIHRDVKPSNILLDADGNAKLADFGLLKLAQVAECADGLAEWETNVKGTWGYLDPEYVHSALVSAKADVYSFGVVLLNLVTGREALSRLPASESPMPRGLVPWVEQQMRGGGTERDLEALLDPALSGRCHLGSVAIVTRLALKCTDRSSDKRPDMGHCVEMLKSAMRVAVQDLDD